MKPIFTAFYTRDTLYEAEAARLRQSLEALGLDHDLVGIEPRGSWAANARYTAEHSCRMLEKYDNRPVVQLDADAVVLQPPTLFDTIVADIGVHYRGGAELLNGTIYWAPTSAAREVARVYYILVQANPRVTDEQTMLARAIGEVKDVRVFRLPASYCWIHDIMRNDLPAGTGAVIEHLQASREQGAMGDPLRRRRQRIAKLTPAKTL